MHEAFGTVVTAMVTPLLADGGLDTEGLAALATHLVDSGNDGLVVNGTTGEAPTTTDEEKALALRVVLEAVGNRARVIAGVGTNDTAHTVELARQAEQAGAHALLVVTPYYNKPPQAGLLHHFRTVADATDLPNMLYDIPGRSGTEIATATLVELAEHPRIAAVKDAKGDLAASTRVLAATDLLYYSGDDALNLPLMAVGGTGFVSVVGHFLAPELVGMRKAFLAGDLDTARALHAQVLAVTDAVFVTQAAMTVKGALARQGLPAGPVRPPLVPATDEQVAGVLTALEAVSG
jgi:4-hydroxy-tetrahydrodipicolinate synthase